MSQNNLITEVKLVDEAKENFLVYAEEVLTDRAIPSAIDGLLSVHRKLIWTMEHLLKMDASSKYKKSASIVGTTLASSYYHGDSACYGAMCKIAQTYLMRYPLVDGEGNFGSQLENGTEASSRYTNARPSKFADLMMKDFKKNIVPLKETYNGEYMEPVYLPAYFPNALANGREAISVSMSHCSLPNNLTEICNAAIARLNKNSSLTVDELMEHIKGPDFPLENDVINSKDIRTAFATGHSSTSLKVRGKYEISGNSIIFRTIPYRTYRNKIKEQITKNIDVFEELLEDFSDESNVGENKLVFKVRKGIVPETVVNKLFALTDLQTTLSYNMNFIVNGTPKMCSMMELLDVYVNQQINNLLAITTFDKEKAEARLHIVKGLLIVIKGIDRAIQLIKSSVDKQEARERLIAEFDIDTIQADAVLDMKLVKLTRLDNEDLLNEKSRLEGQIAIYVRILTDEQYRNSVVIKSIEELRDKYGDARRTNLLNIEIPKEAKEKPVIIPEDVVVVVTESGLVKRVPTSSYRVSRRGTAGVKNGDDVVAFTAKTNTVDTLLVFSDKGKMYRIGVDSIPEGTNASRGTLISNLIKMENEKAVCYTTCDTDSKKFILFSTKGGLLKKTSMTEYKETKRGGIAAIKIKDGDSLISVSFVDEEDIFLVSKNGFVLRTSSKDLPISSRVAQGVKGISFKSEDEVVACLVGEAEYLAIVGKNGKGKRVETKDIPTQNRGGKGQSFYKEEVSCAALANDGDKLLITGKKSSLVIEASEIPVMGKTAIGNILAKQEVLKITKV